MEPIGKRLLSTRFHRLISCSRHGCDSREHHFQQRSFSHTCQLQPLWRGSHHGLHLTAALLFGPEWPPHQSCAQPHAEHDAARDGDDADERGNGRSGYEPGDDAGQPHGNAVRRALSHGAPGHHSVGSRRNATPSAHFGWAQRSRRNNGCRGLRRRWRDNRSKHQSISSLRKCHHYVAPLSGSSVVPAAPLHSPQVVCISLKIFFFPSKALFHFKIIFHILVPFISQWDILWWEIEIYLFLF